MLEIEVRDLKISPLCPKRHCANRMLRQPSESFKFALPVSITEGGDDVVLSPAHKIRDIALQLQVKPRDMICTAASSTTDTIMLLCQWPWFSFVAQAAPGKLFHARSLKLTADVCVQHPTSTTHSISRTMKFAEQLSSSACRQGVPVKLADNWSALVRDGWLGSSGHVLVIVSIRGDFNVLERSGIESATDDVLSKMWSTAPSCEFHIAAQGQEIRCHRSVLAAASPVFAATFGSDMQEGCQSFACIDEVPDDILAMVQFVYTGRLPLGLDCLSLLRILRIADCYQLPKLFQVCKSLVLPLVTKDNIAEVVHSVSLLEFIPECKVIFDLLLHDIQRDFQSVATIAKRMVQARVEMESCVRDQQRPNSGQTTMGSLSVGVQCETVDEQLHKEAGGCQAYDTNSRTLTPTVCLDRTVSQSPCFDVGEARRVVKARWSRWSHLELDQPVVHTAGLAEVPMAAMSVAMAISIGGRPTSRPHRRTPRRGGPLQVIALMTLGFKGWQKGFGRSP